MKRIVAALALAGASLVSLHASAGPEVTVYKSPLCGCCGKWIDHLRANGFSVKAVDQDDVSPLKAKLGVPEKLGSCHTALVNGYVVEGHVPAADIRRLLAEKPRITGLSAPGMPAGSPGMDVPNSPPYDVVAFDEKGKTRVWARH